jgi:signal transduction histidine kinase
LHSFQPKYWPPFIAANFLPAKSSQPIEAFRERVIRVVVLVAAIFFFITGIADIVTGHFQLSSLVWYGFIYTLITAIIVALRAGKIRWAGRLMVLSVGLILLDHSKAYWSPGTVIFTLVFTFLFELVLDNWLEFALAIGLNLCAYTWIVATSHVSSPFGRADFFSNPYLALLTVYAVHVIIVGVTYLIRREQQECDQLASRMEQHEAEVLRQFLSHTSHDLRTALTKVRLPLYRIKHELSGNDTQALAALTHSVDELEKLLLTMLEMSELDSISRLTLTPVDMQHLLTVLVERVRPAIGRKQQDLRFVPVPASMFVYGDPQYMARAIHKVLENATRFTPPHGTVTVSISVQGTWVVLRVNDTGPGIDPDKLPFIFDRFFRGDEARTQSADKAGNGLGLAIAKKIIDLHGGQIAVESMEGKGSTFTICLPLYQPTKPAP